MGVETDQEERVAPLELFFDLVFVFAITQVTALMSEHPTWEGLAQGMLVLAAIWWAWVAYSWMTNVLDTDEGLVAALDLRGHGHDADRRAGGAAARSATTASCSASPT